MNINILERAIELASNYFESINISITNECIREQAEDWYDGTKENEPEFIATAVVKFGGYNPNISVNEVKRAMEFSFLSFC